MNGYIISEVNMNAVIKYLLESHDASKHFGKFSFKNGLSQWNVKVQNRKKPITMNIDVRIESIEYNQNAPVNETVQVSLPSVAIHEDKKPVERTRYFKWDNVTDDLLLTGQHLQLMKCWGLIIDQLWGRAHALGYSFRLGEQLKKAVYHQMFWDKHPETYNLLITGKHSILRDEYFVKPSAIEAKTKKIGYSWTGWDKMPVKKSK